MSFNRWFWSRPRWQFLYFLVGALAACVLAVFHFMDGDTAFMLCGCFIFLNLFGIRYFRTLIGLKKEVDHMGSLNARFGSEHTKLSGTVDLLKKANENLKDSQNRIRAANVRNRQNLSQFSELQATMKEMNLRSVSELASITNKAKGIGNKWKDSLIDRERDMLHTVFDRYEEAHGKAGMTKADFQEFAKQLPESYQQRFARLGTFEKVSHDGVHLNFSDFDAALDLFAEMDALDCDIEFEIEKEHDDDHGAEDPDLPKFGPGESTLKRTQRSTAQLEDEQSVLRSWRTQRKTYDKVRRKIKVTKRTYRSIQARDFTSSLGFAIEETEEEVLQRAITQDQQGTPSPPMEAEDDDWFSMSRMDSRRSVGGVGQIERLQSLSHALKSLNESEDEDEEENSLLRANATAF